MLDEIKPEIKPEAAQVDLDLDKQLKAFQERLQSQTVLPPPTHGTANENGSREAHEEQLVQFGWEKIDDDLILPYIKRESVNYVAIHIVAKLVYKRITNYFSNETLLCITIDMVRMSPKEAETFNEININHSDRTVVGNYCFKANEFMIRLHYVKKLVAFYNACRNLILRKIKENGLFGFIQIAGENRVPFIQTPDKILVPLFYFEGQSEYLDAKSIDLTDRFQIGYLKFCCMVQKINKDYYDQNSLKVVDLEDVKKLFPEATVFELALPERVNQDLLAPEVRIALLHGIEEVPVPPKQSSSACNSQGPCKNGSSFKSLEGNNQKENPQANKVVGLTRAQKRPTKTPKSIKPKRSKTSETISTLQSNNTIHGDSGRMEEVLQRLGVQHTNYAQDHATLSQEYAIAPYTVNHQGAYRPPSNPAQISELATITPYAAPSTTFACNGQVTNVPYRSPPSASSPGLPQHNQIINGAAQSVPGYSQMSTAVGKETNVPILERTTNIQPGGQHVSYGTVPYYPQRQQILSAQQPNPVQSRRPNFSSVSGINYEHTAAQQSSYPYEVNRSTLQYQDSRSNKQYFNNQMQNANSYPHHTQHLNQKNSSLRPSGISIPYQNVQNHPLSSWENQIGSYRQQYGNHLAPVVPNNYFAPSLHNCPPSPTTPVETASTLTQTNYSHGQDINNNYFRAFNAELDLTLVEHPQCIDSTPEFYSTTTCVIKGKHLLGISKSPIIAHCYLVNFSEVLEKVPMTQLPTKVKPFYRLNPVQKVQWEKVTREKQIQFVGPFKDVFVDYNDVVTQ